MISACPVRATRPARAFASFILLFAVLEKTTRLDQIWSPLEGVSTKLLNFPFFCQLSDLLTFRQLLLILKKKSVYVTDNASFYFGVTF